MELASLKLIRSTDKTTRHLPAARSRPLLGEILRAHGLVSEQDLDDALRSGRKGDVRLGHALCANGVLQPKGLVHALERQWGIRRIDLAATPPDSRLVSSIGVVSCLREATVPWRRVGAATVVVTEDPDRFEARRDRYEAALGPVMLALAAPGEVGRSLAHSHRAELVARAETRVDAPLSCRTWRSAPFRLGAALCGIALLLLALTGLPQLCAALLLLSSLSLVAVTGLKLAAAIAQGCPPRKSADIVPLHATSRPGRLPMLSLLVPLFREEHIAGHLIHRLSRLTYPRALLDVCLIVEESDTVTQETLRRTDLPAWMRVCTVPAGSVQTKPRAMNYALDFCRGSVIGIYDAEDAPEPEQLQKVALRFAQAGPKVACLQGALDFYNTKHNWMSRCFTLEYATWFRVMLPGVARLGLAVPLGGTTVFFRRSVLEDLGAWDAQNVTEDADLGIRLCRAGYRTEVIDTVTEEEANARPWPWVKQRSRWLKGYAMTYAVHMRDPVQLWKDLGAWPFVGFQIMFLGTLIQFAAAPLLWSMWLIPFGGGHPVMDALSPPWLIALCALFVTSELVSLGLVARALHRTRRLHLLGCALTLTLYFALASAAMYKALFEMFHKPFYWDKTQHGQFGSDARLCTDQPTPASRPPDGSHSA